MISIREIFLPFIRAKQKELLLLFFLSLSAATLSLVPLFAVQWILNTIDTDGTLTTASTLALGVGIASIGATCFLYFLNRRALRLDGFFASQIQPLFWKRLFLIEAKFFRLISTHALLQKVMAFERFRENIGHFAIPALCFGFSSIVYLIGMMIFSIHLTVIALLFLIGMFSISFYFMRKKTLLKNKIRRNNGELSGFFSQILHAIQNVRALNLEKRVYDKWQSSIARTFYLKNRAGKAELYLQAIYWIFPLAFLWIILIIPSVNLIFVPIGNLFAFYLALIQFYFAIEVFMQSILRANMDFLLLNQSKRMFSISIEQEKRDPGVLKGFVEFKQVSFQYPSSTKPLIQDFSLTISRGEKIALTGPSKSGKTTFVRLLLGLEYPEKGEILLDQKKISDFNLQKIRQQIGVVFHTEGIFAGNIYENITVGRECSLEAVEKAMKLSDFQKDFELFPMGLNTLLPTEGTTLSSGQRQRLLLTRALLMNPSILILDQGLDLLDKSSRGSILNHLKSLSSTQIILSQESQELKGYVDKTYSLA